MGREVTQDRTFLLYVLVRGTGDCNVVGMSRYYLKSFLYLLRAERSDILDRVCHIFGV